MIPELEKQLGVTFPSPSTFGSTGESSVNVCVFDACVFALCPLDFQKFLNDLCLKHGVECSSPRTSARLLDKV